MAAALDVRLRGTHGITLQEVLLLELLTGSDRRAHRICALARAMRMPVASLARQVRRLEQRGLVSRSPSRRDPRGMIPRITGEGHKCLYTVMETYALGSVRTGAVDAGTGALGGHGPR